MGISHAIDGFTVDHYKARHNGTVDLESEEAEAMTTGEIVVTVDVSVVKDPQFKTDKVGDISRIVVLAHTDTRIVTGDLKELLVERLGLYGADTSPIIITPGQRTEAQRAALDETGEIPAFDDDLSTIPSYEEEPVDEFGAQMPQGTVVGRVGQGVPGLSPTAVNPFGGEVVPETPQGEVVGRLKGGTDPAMATLYEDQGWS